MARDFPPYPDTVISRMPSNSGRSDYPVFMAAALVYTLLLPPQVSLHVVSSSIPAYRVLIIAYGLYVVGGAARGRLRICWPDTMVFFATGWICLSMFVTSARQDAIMASIAHILDIAVTYLFARLAIRELRHLRMLLVLLLPGVVMTGLAMITEAVLHRHIVQELFSSLTGGSVVYLSSPRFGLMRAQGPFPHPILAGIFMTTFLPLYALSDLKLKFRAAGSLAAMCSFFAVSSATLLGLGASLGALCYNWLTKRVTRVTWSLFFFAAGVLFFLAELGTRSGTFSLLVRYASLNSSSAFNRINIWRYGSKNVAEHPWFGIGYADWERPAWMVQSMDNHWLLISVRFGLPASVAIGLATFLAVIMLMRKSLRSPPADADCERGVIIALLIYALGMISVALWLAVQVWFFILIAIAVSLAQAPAMRSAP